MNAGALLFVMWLMPGTCGQPDIDSKQVVEMADMATCEATKDRLLKMNPERWGDTPPPPQRVQAHCVEVGE